MITPHAAAVAVAVFVLGAVGFLFVAVAVALALIVVASRAMRDGRDKEARDEYEKWTQDVLTLAGCLLITLLVCWVLFFLVSAAPHA